MTMKKKPKPITLIILDGWGYREEKSHNPLKQVVTPTFDKLFAEHPHILLEASGEPVGLPQGQIGNSEVGHLHIGAGRKVPQDLVRIDNDVQNDKFSTVFKDAISQAKKNKSAIHVLGLLSPGGVHSHERQIAALIKTIAKQGVLNHYLHALLDGRDVPPKSAMASLEYFNKLYQELGSGQIATITGRYYAMDRDRRWERTKKAYDLFAQGKADYYTNSATTALQQAYGRGETDEFVAPTAIYPQNNPILIRDNDVVIFMNFRADRARQLTLAFTETHFEHFNREKVPQLASFVTLTEYAKDLNVQVAYPPLKLTNTLGEYLSKHNLHQLRIAETEKYAHVTYFLNGGVEKPYPNESRILIPSPKVATYDLKPEMSAVEVTNKLVEAIEGQEYDAIMCNYANPDMIGHTGVMSAANQAVAVMDHCLKRISSSLKKVSAEALITADHGNIELMYDEKNGQPHTAHTTNLVPLIYFGRRASFKKKIGALDDIAPTMLYLMGLEPPKEMTGQSLLTLS